MSSNQPRTVIAGGGRVGRRTANILSDRGYDIVVIEPNSDRAQTIADDYVATVIEGDATRPAILEQVNLDRVDVIAALTAETGTNLAICLAATRMVPDLKTFFGLMLRPAASMMTGLMKLSSLRMQQHVLLLILLNQTCGLLRIQLVV